MARENPRMDRSYLKKQGMIRCHDAVLQALASLDSVSCVPAACLLALVRPRCVRALLPCR